VEADVGPRRIVLVLLGSFAGMALALAVLGIYGVMAYSVAQRRHEVSIRRALGAQNGDILRLIVRQVFALACAGTAAGVGAALAFTRVMRSTLFEVSATDPGAFAAVALLFIAISLTASWIPAHRATRIDPITALRV
jgi:ABC-type antimicrobial peptide transport system permease subunit